MLENYNRRWMIDITNKKQKRNVQIYTEMKTTRKETMAKLNRACLICPLLPFLCNNCIN